MALSHFAPGSDARGPGAAAASLAPMTVTSVDGPGPSVWLTSLDVPGRAPFALDSHEPAAVLPRVVRPLPPLAETRAAPAQQEVQVIQAAVDPHRVAPADQVPATVANDHAAEQVEDVAPSRPGFAARLAEALRVQQREVFNGGLRFARLAPRRSLQPLARPQSLAPTAEPVLAAVPETNVAPVEPAPEAVLALARSRMPQRRPDAVTRLASADLSAPTMARAEAPVAQPARIELPALSRALSRSDQCETRLTRAIPRRGRAADGSAVIARVTAVHGRDRDDVLVSEVTQGNIPDFLRDLVPVTFTGTGPGGQEMRITICVMPDYLAVGSDRDFVRVPLGLPAAMRVAERFDMVLPTTTMVDAIYQQASVRLAPSPMTPGPQMETTGYFQRHNATVQQQLASAGGRLGQLVSGHKKDLVLTNRLERNPGRVAIYGWHRTNGRAIQPLSTVHGAQYADYSHGIRLVSRTAYINGRAVDLRDILSDGRYAGLVSDEGTITNRTLLASLQ